MTTPNWLKRMNIWRVALVDRPANPDASIVFYKSGKTKRVDGKDLPASEFAHVGNPDDPETWKLPVHDASHVRNALARFNQTQGMSSEDKKKAKAKIMARAKTHGVEVAKDHEINQTPEPDEQEDAQSGHYGDEDDKPMNKGRGEPDKEQGESSEDVKCAKCGGDHATADHDKLMKDGPGLSDVHVPAGDIHKGERMEGTQADRDQLVALKKQIEVEKQDKEALKTRLEKMEGEQRRERYIAKVKRFNYLPGVMPDDFWQIFAKIDGALSEPEREKYDKMLTAVNAQLRQSELFKEYGVTGHKGTGSEPENQLNALTKAEQEKDPKLTRCQAYAKVLKDNPELYNEYLIAKKEAGRS